MKKIIIPLIVLFLSGCVNSEQSITSYVGSSSNWHVFVKHDNAAMITNTQIRFLGEKTDFKQMSYEFTDPAFHPHGGYSFEELQESNFGINVAMKQFDKIDTDSETRTVKISWGDQAETLNLQKSE